MCDAIRILADSGEGSCPEFRDSVRMCQDYRDSLPPWLKLKCNFAQHKQWMLRLSTMDANDDISSVVETMVQGMLPANPSLSDAWGVDNLTNACVVAEIILQIDAIIDKFESGQEGADQQQNLEDQLQVLDSVLKDWFLALAVALFSTSSKPNLTLHPDFNFSMSC